VNEYARGSAIPAFVNESVDIADIFSSPTSRTFGIVIELTETTLLFA
jgi:hypothetical protein